MSPRFPLFNVFWQGEGDAGASSGVGGSGGTSSSDSGGGGSGDGDGGGGGGGDGIGSVSAAPGATGPSGGLSGFSVAGVNAPGPSIGGGATSSSPGGGQAAPGIGPAGGVSTAGAVGGGVSGGGHGFGGDQANVAAINNILHSVGVQGQNPAVVNLLREAGLLGGGQGGVLGNLRFAAPSGTVTASPIGPPSMNTAEITALNQALAALHSGIGGSGGLGTPAAPAPAPPTAAPSPTATAVTSPRAAPAAPPAHLGLGTPAAIGNVGGDTSTPASPFSGGANPSLADLASTFLGGNKVPPASTGAAGGSFGPSPWMMGGTT